MLGFDAEGYVRVTEVLSLLGTWDKVPIHIRDEALEVGKEVHSKIEDWIKKEEWKMDGLSSKIMSCLHGFQKWSDFIEGTPSFCEQKLKSKEGGVFPYKVRGTVDAVFDIGGMNTIIDFKTTSSKYPKPLESYELQIHAYRRLFLENYTDNKEIKMMIVFLSKKDNDFRSFYIDYDKSKDDKFQSLLEQYQEKCSHGEKDDEF